MSKKPDLELSKPEMDLDGAVAPEGQMTYGSTQGDFFMFFPFCIRLFKLMGYSCLLGGDQSQGKC